MLYPLIDLIFRNVSGVLEWAIAAHRSEKQDRTLTKDLFVE